MLQKNNRVFIFTVSKEQPRKFQKEFAKIKGRRTANKYLLAACWSFQDPKTDTIAAIDCNEVFRTPEGELSLRPGMVH
jgi:hypothetical protein